MKPSALSISKLGILSHDYRSINGAGFPDFSELLPQVLKFLDQNGCDSVLFPLYTIVPRSSFDIYASLSELVNIKLVFLEEFSQIDVTAIRNVTYYNELGVWREHEYNQSFATLSPKDKQGRALPPPDVTGFVATELPNRILGNFMILLCGETNGVKYSPRDKQIHDSFGLARALPASVNFILNPVHDRMTRFEMNLKRAFLSRNGRWVISVWNKGRLDRNGRAKDGVKPAWTVYHSGVEIALEPVFKDFGLEIGILDFNSAELNAPADDLSGFQSRNNGGRAQQLRCDA